jgi:hypothetical protein
VARYSEEVLALPAVMAWLHDAEREPWTIDEVDQA